jgi:hypothetical protein
MAQFTEVLDEIQISPSNPGVEQQRQSNPNIISKFRSNFLPNTRQLSNRHKLPSFSTMSKPSQESTTGNQILLSPDESTPPKFPPSTTTTTTTSPLPTTPTKASTFIQDDAHV